MHGISFHLKNNKLLFSISKYFLNHRFIRIYADMCLQTSYWCTLAPYLCCLCYYPPNTGMKRKCHSDVKVQRTNNTFCTHYTCVHIITHGYLILAYMPAHISNRSRAYHVLAQVNVFRQSRLYVLFCVQYNACLAVL